MDTGTTQSTQLDPTVQALTQAIGQQESGVDYTAQGKNGEYGAYQMTPGFVQEYSPKILGTSYQDATQLTPDQQNQLEYGFVNMLGTTGDPNYAHLGKLTPAQIASAQNSGDPNAYLDPEAKGTNARGVSYDVPAYVQSVEQKYNQNISKLGGSSPDSTTPPPQSNGWDTVANGILGLAAKGAQYAISNVKPLVGLGITGGLTAAGAAITSESGGWGALPGEIAGNAIDSALGLTSGTSGNPPSGGNTSAIPPEIPDATPEESSAISQAGSNSQKLAQVYNQAMGVTQGNSNLAKDPNVQAGIQTNAMFGLTPEIDQNGRMDFTQATQKSNELVGGLSSSIGGIIASEGSQGDFENVRAEAKKMMRERVPETDWDTADKAIDEAIDTYKDNSVNPKENQELQSLKATYTSPKTPNKQKEIAKRRYEALSEKHNKADLSRFEKMRMQTGAGKKWGILEKNSPKHEAYKSLSKAARKEVEKNTKNKELYNATMKMEQNLINGKNVMKKLQGKKAIKQEGLIKSILHAGGNAAGAYIGDKIGGTTGAIIGYLIENHLSKAVDKRFGKNIFESPGIRKSIKELQSKSPLAYKVLTAELQKQGVNVASNTTQIQSQSKPGRKGRGLVSPKQ